MHTWKRPLVLAMLTLSGCSSKYSPPPLSSDHPANPDAVAAPMPEHSPTLAIDDPPAPTSPAGAHHGMHGEQPPATAPQHQHNAPAMGGEHP